MKGVMCMKRLETESGGNFSYSSDIAALEEHYKKQSELVRKGNAELATLELMMLGCALDFINYVHGAFGIELDGSEKSVAAFEEVADGLSRGAAGTGLFDKENSIARKAGAYFGFLIIANIGGSWIDTENGIAVLVEGREVYVLDFAEKRLESGSGLDAKEYYRTVRSLRGSK